MNMARSAQRTWAAGLLIVVVTALVSFLAYDRNANSDLSVEDAHAPSVSAANPARDSLVDNVSTSDGDSAQSGSPSARYAPQSRAEDPEYIVRHLNQRFFEDVVSLEKDLTLAAQQESIDTAWAAAAVSELSELANEGRGEEIRRTAIECFRTICFVDVDADALDAFEFAEWMSDGIEDRPNYLPFFVMARREADSYRGFVLRDSFELTAELSGE